MISLIATPSRESTAWTQILTQLLCDDRFAWVNFMISAWTEPQHNTNTLLSAPSLR
jgi:hypothetical protein